jgi:hypothetical protein
LNLLVGEEFIQSLFIV